MCLCSTGMMSLPALLQLVGLIHVVCDLVQSAGQRCVSVFIRKSVYVSVYVCVCVCVSGYVCVCVCVRKREVECAADEDVEVKRCGALQQCFGPLGLSQLEVAESAKLLSRPIGCLHICADNETSSPEYVQLALKRMKRRRSECES